MALSLIDQLMYTTVKITTFDNNGKPAGSGTGFFFRFHKGNGEIQPLIVTNKHVLVERHPVTRAVVREFNNAVLHFNLADEDGNPIPGKYHTEMVTGIIEGRIDHRDLDIDLTALPLAPALRHLESKGIRPFFVNVEPSIIPNADTMNKLNVMEDIVMIGYPNGIWDEVNNLPILRRGVTATHPKFDYNGKPQFVIDCACFPGSSGSPVFILNQNGYLDGSDMIMSPRLLFLGVLFAGPQHMATGEIKIVDVPTVQQPVPVSTIPNNLGYVIKSSKILDLEALVDEKNKKYR